MNAMNNKIISRFYVITLNKKPVYVGYTNRPIEQRFNEHKRDKDFGKIKPEIEQIAQLEYGFTWDTNKIDRYAHEVNNKEFELIEQYNTQNSKYQKANGGGQNWADIKYFVNTNHNNPKFLNMPESDVLKRIENEHHTNNYIQHFTNDINSETHIYMKTFIKHMDNLPNQYMQSFIYNMKDPSTQYIQSFIGSMNNPPTHYMKNFINNMNNPITKYINDCIGSLKEPSTQYIKSFITNMHNPATQYTQSFISHMNNPATIYINNCISHMHNPPTQYMTNFIHNMH